MIKGIIFDLDGVLLSTDAYHYRAWKELTTELNLPFDEQINQKLRGISRMDSLLIILGEKKNNFTEAQRQALCDKKNEIYRYLLLELNSGSVSDSVRKTLFDLRNAGILLAVGSSSKNSRFILERTGLLNTFDAIVDGNDISHSKPSPEVFLKAAASLKLNPQDCLVVEDAQAGIEAATRGGFIPVAIGPLSDQLIMARHRIHVLTELISLAGEYS